MVEMISSDVGHYLLPLQSSSGSSSSLALPSSQTVGGDRVVQRLENQLRQSREQIANLKKNSTRGGGGGKGGGKDKGKGQG